MKSLTHLPELHETSLTIRRFSYQTAPPRLSLKPITSYARGKIEFFLKPERPSETPMNELHKKKLAPRLDELIDLKKTSQGCYGPLSKDFQHELTERIIRKSEFILKMNNIRLKIIDTPSESSKELVRIRPLTMRHELAEMLLALVPEISSIPLSFLKKIGFTTLSFCDQVVVGRRGENLNDFTKQSVSSVIQVARCERPEKVVEIVYRMMAKLLVKEMSELKGQWQEFLKKVQSNRIQQTSCIEDIGVSLMGLIRSRRSGTQSEDIILNLKVSELRNKLRVFDPEGFEGGDDKRKRREHHERAVVNSLPVL